MLQIVQLDDGTFTSEVLYKIDRIKSKSADMLAKLIAEKEENEQRKKPLPNRYGYRFATKLASETRQLGLKNMDEILAIENSDIKEYFNAYTDLIAFYNEYFDLPANKQDFCALVGITVSTYNSWENSKDEERRMLIQSIDDYFNSLGFHAGEVGNVNDKATIARMKIKDAGQGLVENNFQATITVENGMNKSPLELEKQIQRLLGGEIAKAQKNQQNA